MSESMSELDAKLAEALRRARQLQAHLEELRMKPASLTSDEEIAGITADIELVNVSLRELMTEIDKVCLPALQKAEAAANKLRLQAQGILTDALEMCAEIPICKTITDFCAHHGAKNFLALNGEQRAMLTGRMEALEKRIKDYSEVALRPFGVARVELLSPEDRKEYDSSIRAFVLREDHYP